MPHRAAATSGTAIAAIHCAGPLADCQAATPSPMSAPISRPNRSARFQPAISGGFIRRQRLGPNRPTPRTPPQRQREGVERSHMPPRPARNFHDDSTHPETRMCDQYCRRNRPPISSNTLGSQGAHMCSYGLVVSERPATIVPPRRPVRSTQILLSETGGGLQRTYPLGV